MGKNSFITKTYFELSDKYIPYFRLFIIFVLVAVSIFSNNFIDLEFLGNHIFLLLYLSYAIILTIFTNFRKFIGFKYPFILVCTDMLLISYAITISGGAESSPIYLFYILFIAYFAIVFNMKLTLIVSCISTIYYLGTVFVSSESFTVNIFIRVFFFYAFAWFTGVINEKLNKFNIKMATQDHLTLLYNRQYLSGELENILLHCSKLNMNLSLIIFDVDNFKIINDNEGHLEGDRILAELAFLIKQIIRTDDIAARYGGDEFIIVLPNTDKNAALVICERLNKNIQVHFKNRINISFGIATFPLDGQTTNDLFYVADVAMYKEKEAKKYENL